MAILFPRRSLTLLAAAVGCICFAAGASPRTALASQEPTIRPPGAGTIRALVVGIDRYPNLPAKAQLSGAAADARDIESALRRTGATDITLLIDTAATRAAFTGAMESLIARSGPGDLVVVTFAGHGSQEKERVPGSEPDGMDEEFLLSLIGRKGPSTRERIIDDEIFAWLKRLATKGTEIIFLADSCHGGGMTKAPGRGATQTGIRGVPRVYSENEAEPGTLFIAPGDDELSISPSIPASDNATFEIPSLTFLAGVDAQAEVHEITIDGSRRGALSYAFARILEGSNLSGDVSREALFQSIHQQVLQLTEQRQSPIMEPRTAEAAKRVLFQKAGSSPDAVKIAAGALDAKIVTLDGTATAPAPAGLYAFWDRATGDVISETRTVLAYAVPQRALSAVAERVGATAALTKIAAGSSLPLSLMPGNRDFASGERFQLTIDGVYGRYLIIVNLAGNGEVQHLYPTGNAVPLIMMKRLAIPIRASPPFGSDTLIVVASKRRQSELELDLALLNGRTEPRKLFEAVRDRLGRDDLLGVITYGTRP